MSVSAANASGVVRQALLEEYQRSPESAPLALPSLRYTTLAEDYRFEKLMARTQGATAADLIDSAEKNAEVVKKGSQSLLIEGIALSTAGLAVLGFAISFPLFILLGLPCLFFGMRRITWFSGASREARYHNRFAADVACYASRLSGEMAITQPRLCCRIL